MRFEEALAAMRAGKRVRRAPWGSALSIFKEKGVIQRSDGKNNDGLFLCVFADDWEVVPDESAGPKTCPACNGAGAFQDSAGELHPCPCSAGDYWRSEPPGQPLVLVSPTLGKEPPSPSVCTGTGGYMELGPLSGVGDVVTNWVPVTAQNAGQLALRVRAMEERFGRLEKRIAVVEKASGVCST